MIENPHDLHRRIMLAHGTGDERLFRNNVGVGWAGRVVRVDGGILIADPRPLHAGLCEGSSDLIGWRTVEIRPEHVGHRIAVFAAIEAKTGSGRPSKLQRAFLDAVRNAGGLAGVARNVEDAADILRGDL